LILASIASLATFASFASTNAFSLPSTFPSDLSSSLAPMFIEIVVTGFFSMLAL